MPLKKEHLLCICGLLFLFQRESVESLALPEKIQEIYKHENGKNLEIFCPVEGQACIAKQKDGNWYRAQIIGEVLILLL